MTCLHYRSTATRPRQNTTKLGCKTFFCTECHQIFNERTGTVFNELPRFIQCLSWCVQRDK